ncbi:16S rRNA (guanine(966)-N(2))-methyltransferase RsmD [Amphibacillus sp. Q70]|uniref:16S rRNA (guanine(966)-N(2))-methyltransferase RsmD n=1 Tax=Amphibacillus sp. Q70 TaxID=3453416 RepID=UPI003F82A643
MRVISGEYKGRSIETVSNKLTRPTSDKVKESLFNIIGPFFSGGHALDLFAGSGSLGIEALSRGISQVVFVDQQMQAIQMIKKNLTNLKLVDRAEVYQNDALRALKALGKRELKFDIIFLDPPYKKGLYGRLLEEINKQPITHLDTTIICEHDSSLTLPETIATFQQVRTEKYGSTTMISFYKRKDDDNE